MNRVLARDERGSVIVMVTVFIPVSLVCAVFAVDVANWFVHHRHLQTQADAAVLAAAQDFQFPCTAALETQMTATAAKYAGVTGANVNKQIGNQTRANTNVFATINQPNFYNQAATDTTVKPICSGAMVDAKVTETDLPWFFQTGKVDFLNAHARVSILQQSQTSKTIPFALPGTEPKVAKAYFINESNGNADLGSVTLDPCGKVNGLTQFSNGGCGSVPAHPLPVSIAGEDVGVRIALGQSSTTCGANNVVCYDATPPKGLLHIRGYVKSPTNAPQNKEPPLTRSVTLTNGTCPDAYFMINAATCRLGIQADIDFSPEALLQPPSQNPNKIPDASVDAVIGSTHYPLAYNTTTRLWESAATTLAIAPAAGPLSVNLEIKQKAGSQTGNGTGKNDDCKPNQPCTTTATQVQRPFSANDDRSGPIELLQVSEGATFNVNSLERGTSHNLVVTVAARGLRNATSLNEPIQYLRRATSQQTHALDCKPPANRFDQITFGCGSTYQFNTTADSSCTTPTTPPNCVDAAPGGPDNPTMKALDDRINPGPGNSCENPSRWKTSSSLTELLSKPDDPRFVGIIVVPFGTFETIDNGKKPVPILDFAQFYITGWANSDPCGPSTDDQPANGEIVGHFVKYVESTNSGGGGSTPCDPQAFGSCVAVLTE